MIRILNQLYNYEIKHTFKITNKVNDGEPRSKQNIIWVTRKSNKSVEKGT